MRRMLPQKLIDYIKEIKNHIYIEDGNVNLDYLIAQEVYSNTFATPNEEVSISDSGITTPAITLSNAIVQNQMVNYIGDGLEIDNGELGVKLAQGGGLSFDENGALQSSGGSSSVVAYEGTFALGEGWSLTNWTLKRAIQNSDILWLTLVGSLTRGSGATDIENGTIIVSYTLPSEVASHIYRQDGTSCNNAPSTSNVITVNFTLFNGSNRQYKIESTEANVIKIVANTTWSMTSGTSTLDIRLPIFLDIGSVQ